MATKQQQQALKKLYDARRRENYNATHWEVAGPFHVGELQHELNMLSASGWTVHTMWGPMGTVYVAASRLLEL